MNIFRGRARRAAVWAVAAATLAVSCVRGYPRPTGQPQEVPLASVAVRPADFDDRYVSVLGTLTGETATACEFQTTGLVLATPEPSIVYLIACLDPAAAQEVARMSPGTRLRLDGTVRAVATQFGSRALVYATQVRASN